MGVALPLGKLPTPLLARLLSDLPPPAGEVILGPAIGEDACALDLPSGIVVISTDPISLTSRDVGRHAVIINANDVAVTGVRPRWFLAAVLLPPGTTEAEVGSIFAGMRDALSEAGITAVGGHTEVSAAVTQPIVVGQMLGVAEDLRIVSTAGARPGDVVVQVGPAPVEGAAVLAAEAAAHLGALDPAVLRAAASGIENPGISVVDAALQAAALGATAMHDLTEGGLAAGLHEVAAASGVRLRLGSGGPLWFDAGVAVCRALGADPWATLASGSLLAAFDPAAAAGAVETLRSAGHAASAIAVAEQGTGVYGDDGLPLGWPERDEVARVLEELARQDRTGRS